jgi:hypothetical protein
MVKSNQFNKSPAILLSDPNPKRLKNILIIAKISALVNLFGLICILSGEITLNVLTGVRTLRFFALSTET